ncbi:MAG: aminoglycoside phosphotransferase family protein [Terracoccus sp.]
MHPDIGLARAVAVELGLPSQPIRAASGSGSVNHVYAIGSGDERWVIRFAKDSLSPNVFEAEAWSATQAADRGVPTPAVTAFGELYGIPYGVQRFVAGRPVTDDTNPQPWSTLGAYGHVINGIQPDATAPAALFTRFGSDLESAWASHLAYNLEQLGSHDELVREGFLTREQQHELRRTVTALRDVPMRFGLSHGDLTPRNLIEPDVGPRMLIDWGSASFGPVPWADLLSIHHDARLAGTDAAPHLDAFLDGMGLDLSAVYATFERFRRLQLLDLVRWAGDERSDRVAGATDDLIAALTTPDCNLG